jgi:hypothetical protein
MGLRILHDEHTVDIPPAIEAEGGAEVERYVAEALSFRAAVADVTSPASPANPPTPAEGAES